MRCAHPLPEGSSASRLASTHDAGALGPGLPALWSYVMTEKPATCRARLAKCCAEKGAGAPGRCCAGTGGGTARMSSCAAHSDAQLGAAAYGTAAMHASVLGRSSDACMRGAHHGSAGVAFLPAQRLAQAPDKAQHERLMVQRDAVGRPHHPGLQHLWGPVCQVCGVASNLRALAWCLAASAGARMHVRATCKSLQEKLRPRRAHQAVKALPPGLASKQLHSSFPPVRQELQVLLRRQLQHHSGHYSRR